MLPEIALTSQFCAASRRASAAPPVEWHSALCRPGTRQGLARCGNRRGARRRRRALGAVPAVQGPRPHRRRRGARPGLQAGRSRPLPGARHGGGARPPRPAAPSCSHRPRRRSKAMSMRAPGAIATLSCRDASPASSCPTSRPSTCARTRPRKANGSRRSLVEAVQATLEQQAAGAAVSQPARLCPPDAVPRLRPPLRLPAMHGLAGRASLSQPPELPSLRLLAADAGEVPQMRGRRNARRLRAGRRAHRRGGQANASPTRASPCFPPT